MIRKGSQLREALESNFVPKAFVNVRSMVERLKRGAEVLINV